MKAEYKGTKANASTTSFRNALEFMIENSIKNTVNTAILVRVDEVEPAGSDAKSGKLTCTPLVSQYDTRGNVLEASQIFDIPYMRYQGGVAAIVCDPCVGDIGLAIFAQQDISLVGETGSAIGVQPASFRSYDMADGLYIGGFLNQQPEIWLELNQEGIATLHAPTKVIIEAPDISLQAENSIELKAKNIDIQAEIALSATTTNLSANISAASSIQSPSTQVTGVTTFVGLTNLQAISLQGIANISEDIVVDDISFKAHTHGNVQNGGGSTGTPS